MEHFVRCSCLWDPHEGLTFLFKLVFGNMTYSPGQLEDQQSWDLPQKKKKKKRKRESLTGETKLLKITLLTFKTHQVKQTFKKARYLKPFLTRFLSGTWRWVVEDQKGCAAELGAGGQDISYGPKWTRDQVVFIYTTRSEKSLPEISYWHHLCERWLLDTNQTLPNSQDTSSWNSNVPFSLKLMAFTKEQC